MEYKRRRCAAGLCSWYPLELPPEDEQAERYPITMRILVILNASILAGRLRLRSGPEAALLESGTGLEIASIF